ncbi:MAG: DUF420 domain-containing protein [Nitrospirae bacterium]|nr:DUF420 domain-containing protein [Nitrospirota bacterium]MBI3352536.1 DUF420 domain-containing protein [Nitrospirota bacterium]
MTAFLGKPGFLAPYGTFGADLSYLLAIGFTFLFMVGWYQAKKTKGQAHHTLTLVAMVAMLAYFVIYYLARELGAVAFEGKEGFGGGTTIYKWVFLPVLNIHISVVTIGIILAVYMILLGFRVSSKKGRNRVLVEGSPKLTLKKFSIYTVIVSVLLAGILFLVRILFRPPTLGLFIAWFSLCVGGGFLLILFEGVAQYLLPDGAKRHRVVGTFTMTLYLFALFTSTATYLMLYVLWPHVP